MKSILLALIALPLLGAPVNRNYGRVTSSNTVEFAPISLDLGNIVDGRAFPHSVKMLNPPAAIYAEHEWLPVSTNTPSRAGFVAVESGAWTVTNGVVMPVWSWQALPPRNLQLSKMKLKANLRQLGVWDTVWEFINEDEDVLEDWRDSVVLDERDAMVQMAFNALKASGVLTAEQVEFIVTNSVTEIEVRQ